MMFALAAALGCDLFDSAAYAIYARDDRYLTVSGTKHLDDLHYLPCDCPVCADYTPQKLQAAGDDTRERLLAEHNLHVSFGEIRRVKQAIKSGNLMELVAARAHAHPTVLDGYRALLDHSDQLEASDPASKGAFFYTSAESARRPEVLRHHQRLARLDVDGEDVLLAEGDGNRHYDESWNVLPPFGPYPSALATTYPLTAETPDRMDRAGYEAAAEGVARLVDANPDTQFTLAHDGWPETALARLPERVDLYNSATGE
jgi:7-cyano-7-deazaguanine tRNA-ribosyltransferase